MRIDNSSKINDNRNSIIITGATSGLGRSLAVKFISAGWRIGAAGRNVKALEELKSLAPERIVIKQIDVCKSDAPEKFNELVKELGGIDIYLHCPGILIDNKCLNPDNEVRMIDTNATGFARMISAAFRYFGGNGIKGRIVAISSIAGCRGLGDLPAYSASKAFAQSYLEALRQYADKLRLPVRIVDIRPGWTRTPLLEDNRKYLLEMSSEKVTDIIFKAALHAKRAVTVGLRWKVLTFFEKQIPAAIWQRIHIPLWKEK